MQNFMNPVTHELHYKPIKIGLFSVIKRFDAFVRVMVWGFCPKCNSSAPEIDTCKICNNDRTSPFQKSKKKDYWNNWKYYNWFNSI